MVQNGESIWTTWMTYSKYSWYIGEKKLGVVWQIVLVKRLSKKTVLGIFPGLEKEDEETEEEEYGSRPTSF